MRWLGRRGSGNIEDRRGMSGGGMALGGGGILVVILGLLFGPDAANLVSQLPIGQETQTEVAKGSPSDEAGQFADVVLGDTEDVWNKIFSENGSQYQEPTMVLFEGGVQTGCGSASSATGPFYCPADQKVYLDLGFQNELKSRFGAGGDFPMAYVIAHEVGHHVQNLMGTSEKVQQMRGRVSQEEYNRLSVMLELQADFYAGVYANRADKMHNILEQGDIEEALTAASAIGDDRIQQRTQGGVTPESFTHGTSAQRMRWFKKGYETGDISQGDTFSARDL